MILLLGQVVSLRDQIKRRQQGLDNGKEVTSAGEFSSHGETARVREYSLNLWGGFKSSGFQMDLPPSWTTQTWTSSGRARLSASGLSWGS